MPNLVAGANEPQGQRVAGAASAGPTLEQGAAPSSFIQNGRKKNQLLLLGLLERKKKVTKKKKKRNTQEKKNPPLEKPQLQYD